VVLTAKIISSSIPSRVPVHAGKKKEKLITPNIPRNEHFQPELMIGSHYRDACGLSKSHSETTEKMIWV
jgi:hypothetical protein